MQDKTNLANWDDLLNAEDTILQVKAVAAGVEYGGYDGEKGVWAAKTSTSLFESLQVGNCSVRTLNMDIFPTEDLPRAAEIKLYVRLAKQHGDSIIETSGYLPKGTFYIDTRSVEKSSGMLTIEAYDAMRKTEQQFTQSGEQGEFPMLDIDAVDEICERIGVNLDERTRAMLTRGYLVQYPGYGDGAYSMREVLGYIGAMYAGNWIINDMGLLQMIVLGDFPTDGESYLVDENESVLKIGGVRIVV